MGLLDSLRAVFRLDPPPAPAPKVAPAVQLVIDLLEIGEGWRWDEYIMQHTTGAAMWIANEAYGLSLCFDEKKVDRVRPNTNNTLAGFFSLTPEDRKALWGAIDRHINRQVRERTNADIKQFAARVAAFGEMLAQRKEVSA